MHAKALPIAVIAISFALAGCAVSSETTSLPAPASAPPTGAAHSIVSVDGPVYYSVSELEERAAVIVSGTYEKYVGSTTAGVEHPEGAGVRYQVWEFRIASVIGEGVAEGDVITVTEAGDATQIVEGTRPFASEGLEAVLYLVGQHPDGSWGLVGLDDGAIVATADGLAAAGEVTSELANDVAKYSSIAKLLHSAGAAAD